MTVWNFASQLALLASIFVAFTSVIDSSVTITKKSGLSKLLPKNAVMKMEDITPLPNISLQQKLYDFRTLVLPLVTSSASLVTQRTNITLSTCGIVWAVSSINGSNTDYSLLARVGRGEGKFRLLAVVYEVLASAARVRSLLLSSTSFPSICQQSSSIELALFIDRDIVENFKMFDILEDIKCTFDRVIYFQDLPAIENSISTMPYKRLHMLVRLAPRPNIMKIVAFLSTPYQYTLYLDGDTAPCPGFEVRVFDALATHDVLVTPNPFAYVSTNGQKVYRGSPRHQAFADFPEVNGGVMGYQWNNQSETLIIRTLELYPHFAQLGFDQDQAMMRHALFESIKIHGIKIYPGKMKQYCRFGWKCEQNSCHAGCVIVHQRACLANATGALKSISRNSKFSGKTGNADAKTSFSSSLDSISSLSTMCSNRARQVEINAVKFNGKNTMLNKANRLYGRVKVLDGV